MRAPRRLRACGHGCAAAVALALLATGSACGSSAPSHPTAAAAAEKRLVAQAKEVIRRQVGSNTGYGGPRTGPPAQRGGLVVFVAADVTNRGIAGVAEGVDEAIRVIGWKLRVLDGHATAAGRTAALRAALALHPRGIILGGFDASEQHTVIARARASHIPVVGWHSGARPGPDPANGLFANVTTDPSKVARLAITYAIGDSDGRAGVAIFFDSQYRIAVEKADVMRALVRRCTGCRLLRFVDTPIADVQERVPGIVSRLVQRYPRRLTYLLAINGNYFLGSRAALIDAGRKGTDPPHAVAAGDGDSTEFERIRSGDYQSATVAEPLRLQGWQLVDELNRALAGRPASGYLAPPRLITTANVPGGDVFDPGTQYRAQYRRIWRR